ncbi:MAG TPA: hypothetical protein EYP17_09750 [Candidatus Latescibacteria bacterium]|nr:hypothetical protein [Candidatus Latescibacterota bacterium]
MILTALFFVLSVAPSSVRAQGYTVEGDRVVVRSKEHWAAWNFPKGTVDIGDYGVKPHFIRKDMNACLNASRFVHEIDKVQQDKFMTSWYDKDSRAYFARGGIKNAGTNLDEAYNIIDGDEGTYWEPDLNDPPQNWWVEVDLGRVVCAKKIVVKFAEDGDPFLKFRIFTSTGKRAFEVSPAMRYVIAGETVKPNKTKKIFEFTLDTVLQKDENWTGGRVVQYIRIIMTDSDLDRAEMVTKEDYEALPREDRGAVDYIWRIAGEERIVTKDDYEKLPEEERGGIRYYRRERPRLAEVEVWTVGENISLGLLERGGSVFDFFKVAVPIKAFDGNYNTWWDAIRYRETGPTARGGMMKVDLGALFWVDAIRIIINKWLAYKPGELKGYSIRVSDGTRASEVLGGGGGPQEPEAFKNLVWETVSPESKRILRGKELFRYEDRFEPRKVRYIEFTHLDIMGIHLGLPTWETGRVAELMVYGEGYVPEVTMSSPIIELGGERNLTAIDWDADVPPGTKVEIRTRTGDTLREIKHYFDKSGKEVTELEYNKLPWFMKGKVTSEFLPGPDWSGWSRVYVKPGDPILSPSPRKYLMIQAKLLSDDPYTAPSISSITVHFRKPVAKGVAAEVYPDRDVPVGREQDFELFIRPSFRSQDPGFDDIILVASRARMKLLKLSLGDEDDFKKGGTEDFAPEDGAFVSQDGDTLRVFKDNEDSLWIRLPKAVKLGGPRLVMVRFRSTLFSDGTVFQVLVGNSSLPGSWQRVDSGDVTDLRPGVGTTAFLKRDERIVGDIEVSHNPFTPNGDGVNDEVDISFSVFKVNTARPVGLEIYNIEGRLIRSFSELREDAAGRYRFLWDGRDEGGKLVPPGVYIARIVVETDAGLGRVPSYAVCVTY